MNNYVGIRLLIVFGTRPELIKLIPIIINLKNNKRFIVSICNTGQHKELTEDLIKDFDIKINYDLSVMEKNQSLASITSKVLLGVSLLLKDTNTQYVMVHGDTTSAFASSLAAFYLGVEIIHIEAGLRTFDRFSPLPEEFNRVGISLMANYHFAPTKNTKLNLEKQGIESKDIFVTGNTVIDLLKLSYSKNFVSKELDWTGSGNFMLMTAHRRENLKHMKNMFSAVRDVLIENKHIKLIYPIHKNPLLRQIAYEMFSDIENVLIIEALDVRSFHNLMARSYLVVSDSGGVQEEAPSFGVPIVLLRKSTERPEGINNGIILAGVEYSSIKSILTLLINDGSYYENTKPKFNPFGDGKASERIIKEIIKIHENRSI